MSQRSRFLILVGYLEVYEDSFGKDFKFMGKSFPVLEDNFIKFVFENMSEELFQMDSTSLSVGTTETTSEHRSFFIDPSLKVTENIVDRKGLVIVKKGTVISPLSRVNLPKALLVLNSEEEFQVEWIVQSGVFLVVEEVALDSKKRNYES